MVDEMIMPRSSFPSCESRCSGCRYRVKPALRCGARFDHIEPDDSCAMDELNAWLVEEAPELSMDEQRAWLVKWANRRAVDVIKFMIDPMKEIASRAIDRGLDDVDSCRMILLEITVLARRALNVVAIDPDRIDAD